MPDKVLQQVSLNEIRKMIDDSEAVGKIDHPYLKGKIREIGFGKLLSGFLPATFKIGSGKIHDCLGNQSPETDILIYSPFLLPPLLFSDDLGVYPLESVFYGIEVKSITTTNPRTLAESVEKSRELRKLQFLNNYGPGPVKTYPNSTFFSYGSDSEIDVFEVLRAADPGLLTNPAINTVCIANRGYWYFSEWDGKKYWAKVMPTEENYEILCFVGGIVNTLIGPNRPLYGYYLLKPFDETKKEILYQE